MRISLAEIFDLKEMFGRDSIGVRIVLG